MSEEIVREGSVAVIEKDGKCLVIRRSHLVVAPGKICFPGGGIEEGETPAQALIRECREEIGVTVEPVQELGTTVTPWRVRLHWFRAEIVGEPVFRLAPAEVAEVLWLTVPEMLEHPDFLESNRPFLTKFF